jgi:hypothetical protein
LFSNDGVDRKQLALREQGRKDAGGRRMGYSGPTGTLWTTPNAMDEFECDLHAFDNTAEKLGRSQLNPACRTSAKRSTPETSSPPGRVRAQLIAHD